MAKYTTFDKSRDEPFPLSRTGIDEFIRCPRTFVLKRKYGVKFPSISPLTLAVATDHLLKNAFDKLREAQSSEHWLFKRYGLERWRKERCVRKTRNQTQSGRRWRSGCQIIYHTARNAFQSFPRRDLRLPSGPVWGVIWGMSGKV